MSDGRTGLHSTQQTQASKQASKQARKRSSQRARLKLCVAAYLSHVSEQHRLSALHTHDSTTELLHPERHTNTNTNTPLASGRASVTKIQKLNY
jgi:hypothetical protein